MTEIHGSANVAALSALRVGGPTLSQSYLVSAHGFVTGAAKLSSEPNTPLACAVLAAQALECTLKAYLAFHGNDEAKLKRYGHDLEALWEKAAKCGPAVSGTVPQWCTILNAGHDEPYYFRYPTGLHGFAFPALAPMVTELQSILCNVENLVK